MKLSDHRVLRESLELDCLGSEYIRGLSSSLTRAHLKAIRNWLQRYIVSSVTSILSGQQFAPHDAGSHSILSDDPADQIHFASAASMSLHWCHGY